MVVTESKIVKTVVVCVGLLLLLCMIPLSSFGVEFESEIVSAGLRLCWEDVEKAEYYRVWRLDEGERVLLGETRAHFWTDKNPPEEHGIKYAVTCVLAAGQETTLVWSYACHIGTPSPRAYEVMAGFSIEWDPVPGARQYAVERENQYGERELIAETSRTFLTDSSADPDREYTYFVTAIRGKFRSVAGCCAAVRVEGVPEEIGFAPEGFETRVFGRSGSGRDMVVYKAGSGENVLLMTYAVHGWEDAFPADGRAHVFTAFRLMEDYENWDAADWTVYIVPCANPDGVIDGVSHFGSGRCSTHMFDAEGALVPGGVDINRCFPWWWYRFYNGRNFNGYAPLACPEAVAIDALMKECLGDGKNTFIDVHGWTGQTITPWIWDELYACFAQRFYYSNDWANVLNGEGYLSAYAFDLGYNTCLFEFPFRYGNLHSFINSRLPDDFVYCVRQYIEGN